MEKQGELLPKDIRLLNAIIKNYDSKKEFLICILQDVKNEFEYLVHSADQPAKKAGQTFILIGEVGGSSLKVNDDININVATLADKYYNSIPRMMRGEK